MKQRSITFFFCLAVLVLPSVGAQGQEYVRPIPASGDGPPTSADLVTYQGSGKTVVVQILNLTPYNIQYKSCSITPANETDMANKDRHAAKSFMLVPVGLPKFIPAAPSEAFLHEGDPGYDPNYVNTTSRPYSMAFSWNDHGEYVVDNWVKWTVKQVRYKVDTNNDNILETYDQDVDLGLWMYRIKPPDPVKSVYFYDFIKTVFTATGNTVSLVLDPVNPWCWYSEWLSVQELSEGRQEFIERNSQTDDSEKMYLASYVVPNPTSKCVTSDMDCNPSTMGLEDSGDAVYSLWPASWAGDAEGELVVSAHLLRGQPAPMCPADPPEKDYVCGLGSAPIFMITVMRHEDFAVGALAGASQSNLTERSDTDKIQLFMLQAGAGRVRKLLERRGRPGLHALRFIILGLDPEKRLVLREMLRSMASGRRPTRQERELVRYLAAELKELLK